MYTFKLRGNSCRKRTEIVKLGQGKQPQAPQAPVASTRHCLRVLLR
jgi:hypothetical protein